MYKFCKGKLFNIHEKYLVKCDEFSILKKEHDELFMTS